MDHLGAMTITIQKKICDLVGGKDNHDAAIDMVIKIILIQTFFSLRLYVVHKNMNDKSLHVNCRNYNTRKRSTSPQGQQPMKPHYTQKFIKKTNFDCIIAG